MRGIAEAGALGLAAMALCGGAAWGQLGEVRGEEPGPLSGGEHGATYRGPGVAFCLSRGWVVELDEAGVWERGMARAGPGSAEAPGDATIRFEPYPVERGGRATVEEFVAHVRETLAAGVPVAVEPLIPTAVGTDRNCASGDEPEGAAVLFTRPGADGARESQRRYFIYAYPREDGRVETLVCSHVGRAERKYSALFEQSGMDLAGMWPVKGGVFRIPEFGIEMPYPAGWRQVAVGGCGMGGSLEEQRRSFMPVAQFADRGGDGGAGRGGFSLEMVQEMRGSLESLLKPLGVTFVPLTFDDGAIGRIGQTESGWMVAIRQDGQRVVKLSGSSAPAKDRGEVLGVMRGLRLRAPAKAEEAMAGAKHLKAQGVSIEYPGAWKVAADLQRTPANWRRLAGSFEPIEKPGEGERSRQVSPRLSFSIVRLDDIESEYRALANRKHATSGQDLRSEEEAFETDSGWKGSRWMQTSAIDGRRGRVESRATEYVLPMPDGVTALVFIGVTSTTTENMGSAEAVEKIWREIAASASLEGVPRKRAKTGV